MHMYIKIYISQTVVEKDDDAQSKTNNSFKEDVYAQNRMQKIMGWFVFLFPIITLLASVTVDKQNDYVKWHCVFKITGSYRLS
jgi:preprotein translocase subunit SecG